MLWTLNTALFITWKFTLSLQWSLFWLLHLYFRSLLLRLFLHERFLDLNLYNIRSSLWHWMTCLQLISTEILVACVFLKFRLGAGKLVRCFSVTACWRLNLWNGVGIAGVLTTWQLLTGLWMMTWRILFPGHLKALNGIDS